MFWLILNQHSHFSPYWNFLTTTALFAFKSVSVGRSLFDSCCASFQLVWWNKMGRLFPWRGAKEVGVLAGNVSLTFWAAAADRHEDYTGLRGGAEWGRGWNSEEPLKRLVSPVTLLRCDPSYLCLSLADLGAPWPVSCLHNPVCHRSVGITDQRYLSASNCLSQVCRLKGKCLYLLNLSPTAAKIKSWRAKAGAWVYWLSRSIPPRHSVSGLEHKWAIWKH